jgi:phosphotriesterase-related protein
MDRFGIEMALSNELRVATVAELCRRGWADRMVLSHDRTCRCDWYPIEMIREWAPKWTFSHLPTEILPALRQAGVSDKHINAMTVENPVRVFDGRGRPVPSASS